MNMSTGRNEFKVGDKVRRLRDRSGDLAVDTEVIVTGILPACGSVEVAGYPGYYCTSNFELVHIAYPNPPHKHATLIKAWADGAQIEVKLFSWCETQKPFWDSSTEYRIKPTQTDKELEIEKLEAQAKQLADDIAKLKA